VIHGDGEKAGLDGVLMISDLARGRFFEFFRRFHFSFPIHPQKKKSVFHAHRAIVSFGSPYFRSMFTGEWKEKHARATRLRGSRFSWIARR
jgi:hypothetical protein